MQGWLIFLRKERKMVTVKETIESGITPISLEFFPVVFFNSDEKLLRSTMTVNSLDLGALGSDQYRFVARRSGIGAQLVRRHLLKLFRELSVMVAIDPDIAAVTVPVYARLLFDDTLVNDLLELQSLYYEVAPKKICIELSADILYEDLAVAKEKIDEIRSLGYSVAISEVGDRFCPVFRLSELDFDYAFMDAYSVRTLGDDSAERIAGSLAEYLHRLDVKVIAPGLDTGDKIEAARRIGADGYTEEVLVDWNREDASSNE